MKDMEFAVSAIFEARPMVAVLNTLTDQVTFLKHEDPAVRLNEPMCFSEYVLDYLLHTWIHPDDAAQFDLLLNPEELRDFARKQKNGILFSFRKRLDGELRWARLLLNVPKDYSDQQPDVLLCLRYLSEREADDQDASRTVNETIRKVVKFDFHTDTSRVLKQPMGEKNLRCRYYPDLPEQDAWRDEEFFIHPDDLEVFRSETERQHVLDWFKAGNSELDLFYRRKIGGLYKWVKLIIQPASDYAADKPVFIYFIVDVHRSMTAIGSTQSQAMQQKRSPGEEAYYENLRNALSFFTQQYEEFYIVDMAKDQYIKYTVDRDAMSGSVPNIGCYSQMAAQFPLTASGEARHGYASLEELRMILEEKVSFEYTFQLPDGKRCRTICTRIESDRGIPTKMLARTVREDLTNRLRVKTFGSFEVYDQAGKAISFGKKKSKQLLAYLIDKYGFPVATADIVQDVLEKDPSDLNAKKYVSTLFRMAVRDLAAAGYENIIIKEWNSLRVDVDRLDCDYYHLMDGDPTYWSQYHNEYMKEYSWAEETNGEILHYGGI